MRSVNPPVASGWPTVELPAVASGSGPAVVLLHGRASHHGTWDPILPWLAGTTAVRLDLVGHGKAPAPVELGPYAVAAQAESVARATAGIPGRFVLVGHSMGGFIALHFALRHPGRLAGLVLEATAAATPFRGGRFKRVAEAMQGHVALAETRGMAALAEHLEAAGELHPVQRPRLLAMQAHAYAAVVRGNMDMPDLIDDLPRIRVPTLVACGLDDAMFAPECRILAERIPGARSWFPPEVGHSPHGEVPGRFGPVLREFVAGAHGIHLAPLRAPGDAP